jgi:NAD(P) transhydrogenase subunit beta
MTPRELLVQATYLAASILFILGLRSLTRADSARRGMQQAALGMVIAVCGTLLHHEIVSYRWILAGLVIGSIIGYPLGTMVPMTAMPQRIAISHVFGALAATLVGVAEYYTHLRDGIAISSPMMAALGFEVIFGALTVSGSFMAFEVRIHPGGRHYRGQNVMSRLARLASSHLNNPGAWLFYVMVGMALLFGFLLVLPIGGADMPVVISLMNSYAGLASSATGFAIGNNVLIIAGALDGASGFILSMVMSKAMNRSFGNVLFGAFGSAAAGGSAQGVEGLSVKAISVEDAAMQLAYARLVIVVPGYGLAVAQAQHVVRELADLIEKRGGEVKYAIHPVAGRMPGHMNVLLAEANVPYDRLVEMDEINSQFPQADVALVVGANDVVNPAARNDASSPIYGMPILNVDQAKGIIVLKRSMNPGFAGIENQLFYNEKTSMLFGDAKQSLTKLVAEVKGL